MKYLLLSLLAAPAQAAVLVSSGTLCTQMTAPVGSVVLVDIFTAEVIGSTPTVVACPPCPACPACPAAPVGISTGSVVGAIIWRPSATSNNCYKFQGLNENGTPIPAKGDWVKCP